jgi:predicted nicotinamide N-methyase
MLTQNVTDRRILEVGCGIGLASLILNRHLADITATDHHPDADQNLQWNASLNGDAPIPFFRTGWEDACEDLGEFDLIIGGDVLYQPDHPVLLANFIASHARSRAEVIIADPRRGNFPRFGRALAEHGFTQYELPESDAVISAQSYKGQVRSFKR